MIIYKSHVPLFLDGFFSMSFPVTCVPRPRWRM